MTGQKCTPRVYELVERQTEKPVTKPVITANPEYVMILDDGEIVRIATERFSTLALVRAVEELTAVLGMRLRGAKPCACGSQSKANPISTSNPR